MIRILMACIMITALWFLIIENQAHDILNKQNSILEKLENVNR